jgi:hypothetical protein
MKPQRFFIWTGGRGGGPDDLRRADALPLLPAPLPLWRSARIVYQWGPSRFEILASACSVRTTPWDDDAVTWLQCKAAHVNEMKPDGPTTVKSVLFPADYVTAIGPGLAFRIAERRRTDDFGLFPPNHPTPAGALSLEEIEQALAKLRVAERN